MANYLGIMSVKLGADYASLQSDLGKAAMLNARYAEETAKKFTEVGSVIGKAIGIAAAAATTAVVTLTKSAINSADELSKLSQKVGVSTEALSALKFQAGLAGVEIDGMQTGLVKFNKSVSEAAGGSKKQAATFAAMGISLRDAQGNLKSTETLLGNVADKFAGYEDGAAKTALAVNLFDRAGADLIPMLNGGSKAMAEAAKEAGDLGKIIGTETAKQAEQFNDNLSRAGKLASGFGNVLAAKLLPSLVGVTDQFIEGQKKSKDFESAAEGVADVLKFLAKAAIITKAAIEVLVNVTGAGIDTLLAFGKIAKSVAEGLGYATAGAIKNISGDFAGADAAFKKAQDTFSNGWAEGAIKIKSAWIAARDGSADAIKNATDLANALDKPFKEAEKRGKDFQNVIGGVGEYIAKTKAPIVDMASGVAKVSDNIDKLRDAVSRGQESLGDLAGSYAQFMDPMDEVAARFNEQIVDIGRAAEEQAAKIQELQAATGDDGSAAEQQVQLQNAVAEAIANATAARDLNIAAIERERDVTGRYLEELSDEARLIGLTSSQSRVETTVLRALAEAKKLNDAAGKEVVKVDAERIRQQAKLNEAMSLAAQINVKSPVAEMIDQAELLSETIKKGIQQGWDPIFLKPFQDALSKLNNQIRTKSVGAFIDLGDAIVSTMKNSAEEGSRQYAALEVAQAALALGNGINAILAQGAAPPPVSFAAMAAMAAAVIPLAAQLGVSIKNFGASGFSDTAGIRQASQGAGSVLGDVDAKSESIANAVEITADATTALVALNRGMLNALLSLQAGLGSAANMLARGAGTADFSGMNLAVGNNSLMSNSIIDPFGFFSGSSKITDEGIIIFAGALNDLLSNIAVGAYQEVQSRSWAFGSTHTNEGISAVSDAFAQQFSLIIGSIVDTVRAGAEALGLLPADIQAALDAFAIEEIRISLKDLSAEEQQAELAAVFSQIFDGLAAQVVPFIEQFQKVGEGLGETLIRIATEVQVVQEGMRQLGLAIDEADPERFAQISDALITAVGGIDAFISGMQSFVANFATDADKLSVATAAINSAFEQAGLTVPATDEAMWALMQTLDATTEEGQQQIATLLRLSDTARQYYDLLDKAEKARLDYIRKSIDIQAELNPSGGFIGGRMDIEQWAADTAQSLNDLARAAGRSGAATRDLTNVQNVAAQRLAQLIEKLKGELRDLAVTLGYTTQADTIESLTSQIESMSSASSDAAGAIGSAIDSMREKMNLLLGDLSPFNDQKKLELALEGLRAGTVDASTVLEIGRRLYASTSNYTNLFNQVMGMAQFGQPDIGSAGGATEAQGRTLAELIAARDALLAAQRPEMADELARRLAELAYATGEDFAAIAEQQGFTLDQLGADLNLNSEQLTAYLDQLQSQFEEQDFAQVGQMFQFEIRSSTDRIVAAITGEPSQALEYSDQRMQQITDQQAADRAASDQRVVDAIDRQTSAMIAASSGDSAELAQILDLTRRDLRETFNGVIASGERGRFNTPVQIR